MSQCVPDRSTIAQCFPDKALAQYIAFWLKGDKGRTGEVLTSKEVKDTTGLYPAASGISSVQGLQVFTNLTDLNLYDTGVSDVSPLSKLVKLEDLSLWGTRVSGVSPLSKLTNLKILDLNDTGVSDVSSLSKLTNLTDLGLWGTRVFDVSPLSKLVNLKELGLWGTRVSDLSPLSKLTKLDYLPLDGTRVLDLSPLSKMNLYWGSGQRGSQHASCAQNLRPSVKLTVNADGSVSLPAPRWTDGTFVAPSSTSPAGGVLDAKRGVVTWKGYDAKASYSYDFAGGIADCGDPFSGHVTGVKPASATKPSTGVKPASTVAMFRLYNPNSGEHFYTGNAAERDHLAAVGWKCEGVGWTAPAKSGAPVYRVYNPNAGDHHYTTSKAERDMLVKAGWRSEGVGWYSAENQGRAPLYR